MKRRLLILGPRLLPFAGVSIHAKRLLDRMKKENDFEVKYLELRRSKELLMFFIKNSLSHSQDIIHIQTYGLVFILCFLLLNNHKGSTIFTVHSDNLYNRLQHGDFLFRSLCINFLKRCKAIIAVNETIKRQIHSYNIDASKINVIPAFLPPVHNPDDSSAIPAKIRRYLEEDNILLVANAGIGKSSNFFDVYGLDLLVELMRRLSDNRNIYLILFIALSPKYYPDSIKTLVRPNIKLIIGGNQEMYPTIARSSIFIRPTRTDGYSISVAESLTLGTPVIASDVTRRPQGTILFKTGDVDDLYKKVTNTIENLPKIKLSLENVRINDFFNVLLSLYKSV